MEDALVANATRKTPMFDLKGVDTLARVVGCHDGDTMRVVFSFAGTWSQFIIRVLHIDSPEIASKDAAEKEAALRVRNRVLQLLCPAGGFEVAATYTVKEIEKRLDATPALVHLTCGPYDKYGRVLAEVHTHAGVDIAKVLMDEGLIHAYEGGTKDKWDL